MSFKRVIHEVHRRSIWQVLLIYLGGSWAVLQVVDQIQQRFAMPDWVYGLAIVLLLVGLPIVLATAFVQEGASGESAPAIAQPALPQRLFTWRNAIGGGVVAFVVLGAVLAWLRFSPNSARVGLAVNDQRSIAVLPFANLSPDTGDAFFAAGIHDEILTHLSQIAALDVRSRTSVLEYQNTTKNLKQIARELGVRFILEGSVRRAGEQARITAQLIDAETDKHMWAETYDGTRADVFGVQTAVAENIARALEAELSPQEQSRLAARPTSNNDAYDLYLRAREYFGRSYRRGDFEIAIGMLERAVALDPSFAVAHAELADVLTGMYWFHYDRSDSLQRKALQAAERALQLDPSSAAAHSAIGLYHYRVRLDYDAALKELRIAQDRAPSDADIAFNIGTVLRRKGLMEEAVRSLTRASQLDPRSALRIFNVAETLMLLRRYDEAKRLLARATEMAPDWTDPTHRNVRMYAEQLGDTREARRMLMRYVNADAADAQYLSTFVAAGLEYLERRPDAGIKLLSQSRDSAHANQFFFRPRTLVIAQLYALEGDATRARSYYDSALVTLEAGLRNAPDDPRLHVARGFALAGLGRHAEAVQAARQATELLPVEKEAWRGGYFLHDAARVYAAAGDPGRALDAIEKLLAIPSELNTTYLRNDPAWDPLRGHPRFRALVTKS